jgi:histidyl-tRNA synthetase
MISAVKGTRDILPDESATWQAVEGAARAALARFGYREIRTPIFEETQLFARGIGGETDIVSKEMYTFEDRDEERTLLTLRPEATAGVVRAFIQNNLAQNDPVPKLYSMGPMFRREAPQKGRQRQFHQINVEAFGMTRPSIDAEIVELAVALLEVCGVQGFEVLLNSVGDPACRPAYVEELRRALAGQAQHLCGDCQRRAKTNPLRVLDCKVPEDQPVIEALPKITDHLCGECREHFEEVRRQLDLLGIPYRVSHRLVRGLDYYRRTTFEVVGAAGGLGAQNSILGGGRYDGLVELLGGPALAGIGFAAGIERLVLARGAAAGGAARRCDVFLVPLGAASLDRALLAQRDLRRAGRAAMLDHEGRGLKSQMKKADRLGARFVAILGEAELEKGVWVVRDMAGSTQEEIPESRLLEHLGEKLDG